MTTNHLSRLVQALALLIAGLLAMIATPAIAAVAPPSCTIPSQTIPINVQLANTVSYLRDRQPDDRTALTPWVTVIVPKYRCSFGAQAGYTVAGGIQVYPGLTPTGQYITGTHSDGTAYKYTIWKTNLSGVGVAFGSRTTLTNISYSTAPCPNTISLAWRDPGDTTGSALPASWWGVSCNSNGGSNVVDFSGTIEVALVKIGTLSAGTVNGGLLFQAAGFTTTSSSNLKSATRTANTINFSLNPTTINLPTCSAVTKPSVVQLPTISVADLLARKNDGSTGFDIILTCPTASDATSTNGVVSNLRITFTDNTDPTNVGNALTLVSQQGSATGVQVEIVSGTTAVSYGPNQSTIGTKNQMAVPGGGAVVLANVMKAAPTTVIDVPLTARYVATKTNVKPGLVKAVATYTLSYQ